MLSLETRMILIRIYIPHLDNYLFLGVCFGFRLSVTSYASYPLSDGKSLQLHQPYQPSCWLATCTDKSEPLPDGILDISSADPSILFLIEFKIDR